MRDARLIQKLYCEPLMLSAAAFDAFDRVLSSRMAGGPTTPAPVRQTDPGTLDAPMGDYLQYYRQARATREQLRVEDVLRKYGSVAIVKVHGPIDRNLSQMELDCTDACDLQDVNNALVDCDADPSILTVILDFDTPGGTCVGHAETADRIADMATRKTMVAAVFGECCSLGYYLASQCDVVVIGASAWMGSIGVRCARLDATANLKAQGLQVTLIASSEQKTDGSPAKPMTEAERLRLQTRCDGLYADFKARVRAGRPDVSDDVMQAQVYHGAEAIDAGLADDLGTSLDDLAAEFLALNMGLLAAFGGAAPAVSLTGASQPVLADPGAAAGISGFEMANKNHGEHGHFASGGGGSKAAKRHAKKRTPAPAEPSEKSKRAKAAHSYTGAERQRWAEEHNEPQFAAAIGAQHIPGNGPTDAELTGDSAKRHGIELKTVFENKNQKLTMKASAQKRKGKWERDNKGQMHTVVIDDSQVFNAGGKGQHDESKRQYLYRRGYGSFRLENMHRAADVQEVRKLITTPTKQLPSLAKKR